MLCEKSFSRIDELSVSVLFIFCDVAAFADIEDRLVNKSMKITFIINSLECGGAERVVANLAN